MAWDREIAAARPLRLSWRIGLAALTLVLLIGLGVALAFTEMGTDLDPAVLADRIRGYGEWGLVVVVALMVLHCFVPFPAEILALCAGAVYGTVWGTAMVWLGAMIGAGLSFGLSRWLGRPFVGAVLGAGANAKLDRWTEELGPATLLIARFIPVIAFNLINYAAGLTRVGWGTFLWTTGLGILPLTILMVWMGARMMDLTWPWLIAVSGAGIATVLLCHLWLRSRHKT